MHGNWRISAEQMATHSNEVNRGSHEDKTVPDSVRKRNDAVTLEEDNSDDVDDATGR